MPMWIAEGYLFLHVAGGGFTRPFPPGELGYVKSRPDGNSDIQLIVQSPAYGTQYENLVVTETPQEVMDQIGSGLPARWMEE